MRNPFAARRTATVPAPRAVPAPDVMAGMEYLDTPDRDTVAPGPEVSIQGIDPQVPGRALVPRVHLVLSPGVARPDSVEELLARCGPGDATVRRLTFDVRPFRDVLESRGGWNILAQLVRDPSDRVTNAVFRAAIPAEPGAGGGGGPGGGWALESGDVDADVCVVGDGDTVVERSRHELGRARLTLTPFLASSERLTRRLAETLARPRDRAGRRCLEHALADVVADVPLAVILGPHRDAPHCAVPGAWPSDSGRSGGASTAGEPAGSTEVPAQARAGAAV